MKAKLGDRMFYVTLAVKGRLDKAGAARLTEQVVKWIGMTIWAAGVRLHPCTWTFPVNNCGGLGITHVQPLVESFVAIDTWDEHDGFYLAINSCRHFHLGRLVKRLNRHGWQVLGEPKLNETTLYPQKRRWWRRLLNLI